MDLRDPLHDTGYLLPLGVEDHNLTGAKVGHVQAVSTAIVDLVIPSGGVPG
jgi:hypothetical protein